MLLAAGLLTLGWQIQPLNAAPLSKRYVIRADQGQDILCEAYRVQPGDDLTVILQRRGAIADRNFDTFRAIFKRLNPGHASLDTISAGQVILIPLKIIPPDSLPGQTSGEVTLPMVPIGSERSAVEWMGDTGNPLSYTVQRGDSISSILVRLYGTPPNSPRYQTWLAAFKALNPQVTDLNHIRVGQRLRFLSPEASAPETARRVASAPPLPILSRLQLLASRLNVRLIARGEYHFLDEANQSIILNTATHPILEHANHRKTILVLNDPLPLPHLYAIQRYWPDVRLVTIGTEMSLDELQQRLQPPLPAANTLTFMDEGIEVRVTFTWQQMISDEVRQSDRTLEGLDRLLLMTLKKGDPPTPPDLIRYLLTQGIAVRDLSIDGSLPPAPPEAGPTRPQRSTRILNTSSPRAFIREVLGILGHELLEGVVIHFLYEGLPLPALANMIVLPEGSPVLVDWGNFQGQTISLLTEQGFQVVTAGPPATPLTILKDLLKVLKLDYQVNPQFTALERDLSDNVWITLPGLMLQRTPDDQRVFTPAPLQTHLRDYLHRRGIELYQFEAQLTAR